MFKGLPTTNSVRFFHAKETCTVKLWVGVPPCHTPLKFDEYAKITIVGKEFAPFKVIYLYINKNTPKRRTNPRFTRRLNAPLWMVSWLLLPSDDSVPSMEEGSLYVPDHVHRSQLKRGPVVSTPDPNPSALRNLCLGHLFGSQPCSTASLH